MVVNRSMPASTVIPVLVYEDVAEAVRWLGAAFGFTLRWQVGGHRAQLAVGEGDGAIVVSEGSHGHALGERGHEVMVRVGDADAHHERARAAGVRILQPPADFPYGERQYAALDPGGYRWTFSQSIADVAPESWGATVGSAG